MNLKGLIILKDGVDVTDKDKLSDLDRKILEDQYQGKHLFVELENILSKLEDDYYSFDFYFYIESYDGVFEVLNLDPEKDHDNYNDNNCFIKMIGNMGYIKISSIKFRLGDTWFFQSSYLRIELVKVLTYLEKETKFKVKESKKVLLVISKIVDNDQNRDLIKELESFKISFTRYQKRDFTTNLQPKPNRRLPLFTPQGIRKFSSTSLPPLPNKIVVNSTFDNVVFVNNQAIMFLNNLSNGKPGLTNVINDATGVLSTEKLGISLFSELASIEYKFKDGYYTFDFYFYVELSGGMVELYTFDPFNNNYLIKMLGSFGYFKSSSMSFRLDNNWNLAYKNIMRTLVKDVCNIEKNESKFNVNWEKEILLVITKLIDNDQNHDLIKILDSLKT